MNPKVSVLIPNYNHSVYLKQRIESVLNQTFKNIEIIILDDCSTDNSRNIIEKFKQNELVTNIIYNEVNSGSTFLQWKKGIEIAKGEFIWIAESDDWSEPTFLENLVFDLDSNSKVSLGFVQTICLNQDDSIRFITKSNNLSEIQDGNDFIKKNMVYTNSIVNASMVLFRRETALNISNEYMDFKYCGDWLFWINIAKNNKIYISGKVLNYYRKHDKDVSGKFLKTGKNFIEEVRLANILLFEKVIHLKIFIKIIKSKYRVFITNYYNFDINVRRDINNMFINTRVVNNLHFVLYFIYIKIKLIYKKKI